MDLTKEQIKERNVLAASIRLYSKEQENTRKYRWAAAASILLSIGIMAYIYIDSGACFQNYKKGISLSLFAGLSLMWGYYTWVYMRAHKYLNSFVDLKAMNERIDELGGLNSAPKGPNPIFKTVVICLVIVAIVLTIINNV